MYVKQALAKDIDNIIEFVLREVESQVEAVIPDLFKLILVLEVAFRDLNVAIDSFGVLTLFLPDLTTVEDLLARLSLCTASARVAVIDLINQVWCMLLSNS